MADRYTYIPLVGVFIMVAWGAKDLLARNNLWTKPIAIAGVATVIACSIVTAFQVRHWRNTYALFEHALEVAPENALARLQFGESLNRLGRFAESEQQLARAVQLAPHWKMTRFNYAITLLNQRKHSAAVAELETALRLDPKFMPARFELATVFLEMSRPAEAAEQYREVLRSRPDSVPALNNLAWLLATHPDERVRNGIEAVALAERAVALTRGDAPAILGTLAAAYAEAGRFADAIAAAEKARALAESKGDAGLASKNASLLELYRAGKPYREPVATKQP